MIKNSDLSIVLPVKNCLQNLKLMLKKLENQTVLPDETIIIDTSTSKSIKNYLDEYKSNIKIKYFFSPNSNPGKSRNIGIKNSKNKYIGLLDVQTLPRNNWIEHYLDLIKNKKLNIVFGSTKYKYHNYKSKIIISSTFGNSSHETTPGSVFIKNNLKNIFFIENVRAGNDLEWRDRIKNKYSFFTPDKNFITYENINDSFLFNIYKFYIYALNSAKIDVQRNIKDAYLGVFIILTSLIIPRWNYLIGNWNNNPLYIPNITKIYLSFLIIFLLSLFLFKIVYSNRNSFSSFSLKFIIFIFISLGIYKWNAYTINVLEKYIFYIPHITKIYVSLIIILSIFYRGVYLPLSRKVDKEFLFPFNWIIVGIYGLFLDIVKAPGYIIGGVYKTVLRQ